MPLRFTRALLQVVYLEQQPAPRQPNALRELLGLLQVRAAGESTPPKRRTLDLHGAAHFADDPLRRVIAANFAGDIIIAPPPISAAADNYRPTDWDDCSIALLSSSGAQSISGFDSFSCRRWEKLLVNTGSDTITLLNSSSLSRRDNRMVQTADIALLAGAAAWITRDFIAARWRAKLVGVGETVAPEIDLDFSDQDKSMHQVTVGNL